MLPGTVDGCVVLPGTVAGYVLPGIVEGCVVPGTVVPGVVVPGTDDGLDVEPGTVDDGVEVLGTVVCAKAADEAIIVSATIFNFILFMISGF